MMNARPGESVSDYEARKAEQLAANKKDEPGMLETIFPAMATGLAGLAAANALGGGDAEASPNVELAQAQNRSNPVIEWARGLFSGSEGQGIQLAGDSLTPQQRPVALESGNVLAFNMAGAESLSASNDPGRGLEGISAPGQTPQAGIALAQSQQRDTGGRGRELPA